MRKPSLPVDITKASLGSQNKPWLLLQAWAVENKPSDEMKYHDAFWKQIMFIRDEVTLLFKDQVEEIAAVGTHTSKSILLPVYQVVFRNGTILTLRDNFHNWMISVETDQILEFPTDFMAGEGAKNIDPIYCEGFTKDQVYPSYRKFIESEPRFPLNTCFTIEIRDDKFLFVFLYMLMRQSVRIYSEVKDA